MAELFVYSGLSQLASIDFDCLRTLAYVKFNDIPVKINFDGSPWHSTNGFLPYMKDENNETISGYDEIISHFQAKGYGTEGYLSSSYVCYIESKLLPYLKYILWGDPANVDTVRNHYAKRVGFPFNFVYPQRYIKQTDDLLKVIANFSIEDKILNHNTAELIFNAKTFINMLAEKFEKQTWILSGRDKPTEADATLFAALSILIHLPLQNNVLKSHISECPTILKYVERIRCKFLSNVQAPEPIQKPNVLNRVQKVFLNKEKGTLSNATIKIMFGILAVGSTILFAISNGIVEFVTDDDEMHYMHDHDSDDE